MSAATQTTQAARVRASSAQMSQTGSSTPAAPRRVGPTSSEGAHSRAPPAGPGSGAVETDGAGPRRRLAVILGPRRTPTQRPRAAAGRAQRLKPQVFAASRRTPRAGTHALTRYRRRWSAHKVDVGTPPTDLGPRAALPAGPEAVAEGSPWGPSCAYGRRTRPAPATRSPDALRVGAPPPAPTPSGPAPKRRWRANQSNPETTAAELKEWSKLVDYVAQLPPLELSPVPPRHPEGRGARGSKTLGPPGGGAFQSKMEGGPVEGQAAAPPSGPWGPQNPQGPGDWHGTRRRRQRGNETVPSRSGPRGGPGSKHAGKWTCTRRPCLRLTRGRVGRVWEQRVPDPARGRGGGG